MLQDVLRRLIGSAISAALEATTSPSLGTGALYLPVLRALLLTPSFACDRLLTLRIRPIAYRNLEHLVLRQELCVL